MKRNLAFLSFILFLFSCQDTVKKPDNLIEEEKMINILYDLALIEGIKSDNTLNQQSLNSEKFIYKKYKIDSIQFYQSNAYYASDVNNYQKMYDKLAAKIDQKQTITDSLLKKKGVNKTPEKKVDESIVE